MPQNPVATSNPQNEPTPKRVRSRSTFPLSYPNYSTLKYADIFPYMAMHGVEGDQIHFNSRHELMSLMGDSPILSDIIMHKDTFRVPMRAIMPRTFELFYINPTQGDDVPDKVAPLLPTAGLYRLYQTLIALSDGTLDSQTITKTGLRRFLNSIMIAEKFYSDASLLAVLNKRLTPRFKVYTELQPGSESMGKATSAINFDQWIDQYVGPMIKDLFPEIQISVDRQSGDGQLLYKLSSSTDPVADNGIAYISLRHLLNVMRNNAGFEVTISESVTGAQLREALAPIGQNSFDFNYDLSELNISDVMAYNLVCSHFYVNSHVDFVYSCKIWLAVMEDLYAKTQSSTNTAQIVLPAFTYNGTRVMYDVCSQEVLTRVFNAMISTGNTTLLTAGNVSTEVAAWRFMGNLLSFHQSLRHGDYFNGARPNPLAVGAVTAPVVSNAVSAIDMTKNIMLQRFLNAVNRTGRKFNEYVSGIFGTLPPKSPDEPEFISHDSFALGKNDTTNQAENLGKFASRLVARDDNMQFTIEVNEPCVIIGLASFDAVRLYSKTITRFAFHKNRFDMFNPFYQYIGDQGIYQAELNGGETVSTSKNYAYTLRHMEYKQNYGIASGGFVKYLPGYAMIADNDDDGRGVPYLNEISPEGIRSNSAELDRFFPSLTNPSAAGYFHFIVKFHNQINAERNMEYAPTIL